VSFLRRWWLRILLAGLAGLLLIQLVPYGVDNPPARDEPAWDSPQTRELAVRACYDCHSNETELLWFEHAAPIKWYVANHVREGRAALNFSEWSTDPGHEADDAAEVVEDGSMPPGAYTAFGLHGDAELSDAEVAALVAGLERTIDADEPEERGDR
jgi:mono/diheme cytochrome c family protein